jgi:hypothetical protein
MSARFEPASDVSAQNGYRLLQSIPLRNAGGSGSATNLQRRQPQIRRGRVRSRAQRDADEIHGRTSFIGEKNLIYSGKWIT